MKTTIESLLIPTDFSELAESALKVGVAIAKRQNARIFLLHVVDNYAYLQPSDVFLQEVRILPDVKAFAEERLKAVADRIQSEAEIEAEVIVAEGSPADVICRLAAQKEVSLIVMGTHGVSGWRKFFIGSESFRVIKNSLCPVLTIPGIWNKTGFNKVVFPVRLVPGIVKKYYQTRPIIEKNMSEVLVLGLAEFDKPEELNEVTMLADLVKAHLFADQVIFRTEILYSGDFPKTIIDRAIEFEADLLILSSNIDHNLRTFFLGPFAQQVVNHSNLPVLSVKPPAVKYSPSRVTKAAKGWGHPIDLANLDL